VKTISHREFFGLEYKGTLPKWAYVSGLRSVGRFTIASIQPILQNDKQAITTVDANTTSLGVEVDLQTAQLTLESSHLQALDTDIASDPDVQLIFGKKSMQASIVESSEHRVWVSCCCLIILSA
jgi:hypothetical protein